MVTNKPRFEHPADDTRNKRAHRYDMFGPKIGRPIALFGAAALNAWTMLEADVEVQTYCERPLLIPGSRRVVDFWCKKNDGECFIILLKPSEVVGDAQAGKLPKAVQAWVDSCDQPVRLINPAIYATQKIFLENWGWIIRDISAFSRYLPQALVDQVKTSVQDGATLDRLEHEFADEDPVLLRVAIFRLLYRDEVACPGIRQAPIDQSTAFMRP